MDHDVSEKLKWWARMGYASRGVVYLIIGSLALASAFGQGGENTGSKGALLTLMQQPMGEVLLVLMAVGLLGYSIWRLIQAIGDADHHGMSFKGGVVRGGLLISGVTHLFLAGWVVGLLMGQGSGSSSEDSAILQSQWGQWIALVLGAGFVGVGLAHMFKGITARFERYLKIPDAIHVWARQICRFGLIARGVVWCLIGGFIIRTAWLTHQGDLAGVSEALTALQESAYGTWLTAIVAAGLFAFGIYSSMEARYRRIELPDSVNG